MKLVSSRFGRKANVCLAVAALAFVGFALALPVRATGVSLPDLGIDAADYTTGFATSAGLWIAAGLAVGVVLLAVTVGWRKFRSVAK